MRICAAVMPNSVAYPEIVFMGLWWGGWGGGGGGG